MEAVDQQIADRGGRGTVFTAYAMTRISIHQVATRNKVEHRLGRRQSTPLADHRVTFGGINTTTELIKTVVVPFYGADSVIAVLPEGKGVEGFFGIEDADAVVIAMGRSAGGGLVRGAVSGAAAGFDAAGVGQLLCTAPALTGNSPSCRKQ